MSCLAWQNSMKSLRCLRAGPLLLCKIRISSGHRERGEWTAAELVYALVFTFTLFIFLSSVAYLYFSSPSEKRCGRG